MEKYKCKICGYVYNPEEGDPIGDVPSGTDFHELPGEWRCPVCNAPVDEFEEISD